MPRIPPYEQVVAGAAPKVSYTNGRQVAKWNHFATWEGDEWMIERKLDRHLLSYLTKAVLQNLYYPLVLKNIWCVSYLTFIRIPGSFLKAPTKFRAQSSAPDLLYTSKRFVLLQGWRFWKVLVKELNDLDAVSIVLAAH